MSAENSLITKQKPSSEQGWRFRDENSWELQTTSVVTASTFGVQFSKPLNFVLSNPPSSAQISASSHAGAWACVICLLCETVNVCTVCDCTVASRRPVWCHGDYFLTFPVIICLKWVSNMAVFKEHLESFLCLRCFLHETHSSCSLSSQFCSLSKVKKVLIILRCLVTSVFASWEQVEFFQTSNVKE